MTDDSFIQPETPEQTRRFWWVFLVLLLLLLLCIAFAFLTDPGKQLLDSFGIGRNVAAEPTVEPTVEKTEPPPIDEPTETIEPIEGPTEEPTTEPTEKPTEEPTDEPIVSNGDCLATCNPDAPSCLATLACVPGASSTGYVCWNQAVCQPTEEPPVMVCNPGQWAGCGGMPPDIVCAWNEVAQCQADGTWGPCIWDPGTCDPCSVAVCGDGKCAAGCESSSSCPADCSSPTLACVPMSGDPSQDCSCSCSADPNLVWCTDESQVPDTIGYCTLYCASYCVPVTTEP